MASGLWRPLAEDHLTRARGLRPNDCLAPTRLRVTAKKAGRYGVATVASGGKTILVLTANVDVLNADQRVLVCMKRRLGTGRYVLHTDSWLEERVYRHGWVMQWISLGPATDAYLCLVHVLLALATISVVQGAASRGRVQRRLIIRY